MEEVVVIVGAGPAGLATAACLTSFSISYVILEKEECCGSLWKKRAYDRLHLHLAKRFCELPLMPYPSTTPTFMSKNSFIAYLDSYVSAFKINPQYNHCVEEATYDTKEKNWKIKAKDILSGEIKFYKSQFLVISTGENCESFIPQLPGIDSFEGECLHSSEYTSGLKYKDKKILVIGCGNSGMEVSYDLSNYGAQTSIVVRNPFHVLSREMVYTGMRLSRFVKLGFVDVIMTLLSKIKYGDLSRFGIQRPSFGPFQCKVATGKTPVINVGTLEKIREGEIKVFPDITRVCGNNVIFANGDEETFDTLIFATGYRSAANKWLKDYHYIFNDNSMPKNRFPTHWKGDNGVYCVGLSRMGLSGISLDAKNVSNDIFNALCDDKKHP